MSTLRQRIGDRLASHLMGKYRHEERQINLGIRDPDQPSEALTEIHRALAISDFTPEERARIRSALEIDPLADLGGIAPLPRQETQHHERQD